MAVDVKETSEKKPQISVRKKPAKPQPRHFLSLSDFLSKAGAADPSVLTKICLVTNELAELHQNGGIGTANSGLLRDLLAAGIAVHILYTAHVDARAEAVIRAVDQIRSMGAEIEFLQDHVPTEWMSSPRKVSYGCYQYLKAFDFDLIHFNDYLGNGFFSAQVRSLGVAFSGTPIVVTVHGLTRWAMEADERPIHSLDQQEVCFLETKALEYADAVLGVSRHLLNWLDARSVKLPQHTYIHKNVLPKINAPRGNGVLEPGELSEIVFFARQDVRKGFEVFIKAVKLVAEVAPRLKITFLGKFSMIGWEHSGGVALDELKGITNLIDFRHAYDRDQALAFLQKGGVLAVMPSLDENSPCTVIECIDAGIPFIASSVGGIPELIPPHAHDEVLFEPEPRKLATRVLEILENGIEVPELGFDRKTIAIEMRAFFAHLVEGTRRDEARKQTRIEKAEAPLVSVCVTHFNRSRMLSNLLKHLEQQTYSNFEVVVVDDGSTNPEDVAFIESLHTAQYRYPLRVVQIENSYLGAARNEAVLASKGEFLKFQDDDNVPCPHELETFVKAALWAQADVVTAFAWMFRYESERVEEPPLSNLTYFPLGACLPLGLFRNDYGDANALVRRECFEKLGGFTELRGVGAEDYEFFAKAEAGGFKVRVIPEPLFWYRTSSDGMLRSTSVYRNAQRGRSALIASEQPWVQDMLDYAHGIHLQNEIRHLGWYKAGGRQFGDLHQQLLEFEPNDARTVERLIGLALRYERIEDVMPLVVRSSGVVEARRWLEDADQKLRQANLTGRQFITGRDTVLLLNDAQEFHLLAPTTDLPSWPVLMKGDHGLLVHPLDGRETRAIVPKFIPNRAKTVTLVFCHGSKVGKPVEMYFEIVGFGKSLGMSEWITVPPGEEACATVTLDNTLPVEGDLVIGSRETGGQDFAWAFAKKVIVSADR